MIRGERRQNLARLREIGQVAARHGFGWALRRRGPVAEDGEEDLGDRLTRGQRMREMLEELGPTFVKFGQLLSTRPDLVPPDVLAELRKLQDSARPMPFSDVRQVVEQDLGLTVEQAFVEFDPDPLGAASIGQAHRAVLPDGTEVVVKVQRPDAERQLTADLQLLYQVARIVKERVRRLQFVDTVALVDEFARSVRQELDYRIEARNGEVVGRGFAGDPRVMVPRIFWRQTTARVLTMERVIGSPLARTDLEAMPTEERRRLATRVAETWMQMIFRNGVFHADPHPANIIVIDADRIGVVDFGMVGTLSQKDRQAVIRLFVDVVDQRVERLPRLLRDLGFRFPASREDELREQLDVLVERYYGVSMEELDVRDLLKEIFRIIYDLDITMPARWVLLDKALATLAGVGLEISPEFNVFETARPYARRLIIDRYRPDRVARGLQEDATRYAEAFLEYPFQLSELLDEFKDGELRIQIDVQELDGVARRSVAAANRMSIAIFASAVVLASAFVGAAVEEGPHVFGLALIGIPGFVAGVALFLWIMLGFIRSGRW